MLIIFGLAKSNYLLNLLKIAYNLTKMMTVKMLNNFSLALFCKWVIVQFLYLPRLYCVNFFFLYIDTT